MDSTDEWVKKHVDFNWTIDERIKKINEVLLDCPIKASSYCRVLSTDKVKFNIKYRNINHVRKAYLDIKKCN